MLRSEELSGLVNCDVRGVACVPGQDGGLNNGFGIAQYAAASDGFREQGG